MGRLNRQAEALRSLTGPGAFIRRDLRQRALFVSDAPRTLPRDAYQNLTDRLRESGWQLKESGRLLLLDLSYEGYLKLIGQLGGMPQLPESPGFQHPKAKEALGLLRILMRHQGCFTPDMLPLCREALHLWDREDLPALLRLAGESLAIALRQKTSPPSFFVPLIASILPRYSQEDTHADHLQWP